MTPQTRHAAYTARAAADLSLVTDKLTDTANIGKNSQHIMHSMQPKNTLVVRCSRQLIAPAVFFSHWDPHAAISLEAVPTVHIITRWSGSGGTEAHLRGQLAPFSALMLLVGSPDL